MSVPITLPASLEAFTAYQEQLAGRRLTNAEQEVTAAWLDIINDVSAGTLDQSEAVEKVDHFISQTDDLPVLRFLKAVRCWLSISGDGYKRL